MTVNSHTLIILYVLFAFVGFLTCSTSCCLVTASGIYGMYICEINEQISVWSLHVDWYKMSTLGI